MQPENEREREVLRGLDLEKVLPISVDEMFENEVVDESVDIFELA